MDEENVEAQKNQHDTSSSMVVIDQHQHNKNRDSVAKALLELQFEAHFRIIQLMGCYIATVMSIYDAVNAIATNSGNLPITYTATLYTWIYCLDVVYFMDILSMLFYKASNWAEMKHMYNSRHIIVLIIELISVVPIDLFYFYTSAHPSFMITMILRLRYTLRMLRLILELRDIKNSVGHNQIFLIYVELLLVTTLTMVFTSCATHLFECQQSACTFQANMFMSQLNTMAGKVGGRGYFKDEKISPQIFIINILVNFLIYFYLKAFVVGRAACVIKQRDLYKAMYANRLLAIQNTFKHMFDRDRLMKKTVMDYYTTFWKKRKGISMVDTMKHIVPQVLLTELRLDLSWSALKHSRLFAEESMEFLHHLSFYMKHLFMMPGELVFKKNELKSKMVYIVSGVIHVCSDEDGESPILSLSGGTCLGESSLFISYKSSCTVVCETFTEMDILHRSDLIKMRKNYPRHYEKLRQIINSRYEEAKEYHRIKKIVAKENVEHSATENKKSTSLYWIKLTLRNLLANDEGYMEKYLSELDVIDRLMAKSVLKEMHCAKYLSLLVLADKMHQSTDEIFYKSSCPCTLRPNSIILHAWDVLIAAILLILGFYYPFYVAYLRTTDGWYITMLLFVTIFWTLDLYVQCSTAIETYKGGVTLDFQGILHAKISDPFFILDVLAALPMEAIFYLASGMLENSVMVLVQSNRLLKICRLNNVFNIYESRITHDIVLVKYVKYTVYVTIFLYWTGALCAILMYSMPLNDNNMIYNYMKEAGAETVAQRVMFFSFFAVHVLTSQGYFMPSKGSDAVFYLPMSIVIIAALIFYVFCIAQLIAAHALRNYNKLMLQEYTTTVCFIMKQLKFPKDFQYCVRQYIDHQWASNRGNKLLYPKTLIEDAPEALYSTLRYELMHESLKKVPLFDDIPQEVERVCCNEVRIICIPPGQIMTYAKQVSNQMYIIKNGYCDVFASDGTLRKIIGPGDSFGVLETIMNVPMVHSVVTRTSCVLASVSYSTFKKASAANPQFLDDLNKIVESSQGWNRLEDKDEENVIPKIIIEKKKSFHNFGYVFGNNMAAYYAYHKPWDKLGYFSFLKYITLRSTITTYGRFIHFWEVGRCIFAICSAVLYSIPLVTSCSRCPWAYFLHFLDATAYLDIYLRHHVCYYTKEGVEVSHPKKTALNYWKSALFIDLVACLPFGRFLGLFMKHRALVFIRATHILQLYRLFGAYKYKIDNLRANVQLWLPLLSLISLALIINYLSILSLARHCDFYDYTPASELYTKGVFCTNSSFMSYSLFDKPLTPMRVYMYSLWNMANIVTSSGIRGFEVMRIDFLILVTIFSVIGFFLVEYMTVVTASVYLSRNVDLTIFQENTKSMLRYLRHKRVDVKLRQELVDYFEFIWRTRKGKRYETSLSCFNSALNEDIMYHIFGKSMEESTVFENASPSFYRSLLAKSLHWMFIRRGVISRVNDVHGLIFFIHKGQVDVLGPDYSRLLVLPVGSYFGNLDDVVHGRRTLTMVAKGHVECLVIYTSDFYRILKSYPRLHFHFKRLTTLNVDYIVGGSLSEVRKKKHHKNASNKKIDQPEKRKGFLRRCLFGVRRNGTAIYIAELIIIILACFFGFILEVYRIMVLDRSLTVILLLYFCDLLMIIKIYIRMHTSYENTKGIQVTDKRKIIKHYSSQYLGFWLDVFTLIPFEFVSAAVLHNINLLYRVWVYARCNRLFRIIFLIHYFVTMKRKVNVHTYIVRLAELVVVLIITIQLCTMVFLFVLCAYPDNNIRGYTMLHCHLDTISNFERFSVYLKALSVTLAVVTTLANTQLIPLASPVTFTYTIAIVLFRILVNLFIAETCATLDIVTHYKTQYEFKMLEYKKHLEVKGVTPVLVEKTMRYLHLLWDKQKGLQWPVVLPELPFYLREAVMNSMFGAHIRNHPVLKGCHVDLIRQMAEKMKTITFFYGDIIAFMGDIDECMYFIHEGEVNALSENTRYREVIEDTLRAGEMFGLDQGLYPRVGHTYTYKAATVCFIVQLDRKKWIHLLDFFPASKELIFDEAKAEAYRES